MFSPNTEGSESQICCAAWREWVSVGLGYFLSGGVAQALIGCELQETTVGSLVIVTGLVCGGQNVGGTIYPGKKNAEGGNWAVKREREKGRGAPVQVGGGHSPQPARPAAKGQCSGHFT